MGPERLATCCEAALIEAVVEATASWAIPPKMLFGRQRYTFDRRSRERYKQQRKGVRLGTQVLIQGARERGEGVEDAWRK